MLRRAMYEYMEPVVHRTGPRLIQALPAQWGVIPKDLLGRTRRPGKRAPSPCAPGALVLEGARPIQFIGQHSRYSSAANLAEYAVGKLFFVGGDIKVTSPFEPPLRC